jgi:hypothetical protein
MNFASLIFLFTASSSLYAVLGTSSLFFGLFTVINNRNN